MGDPIESTVRRVVARHLRVPSWLLVPSVSLRDDLASDGEAIRGLVLAVEGQLGVRMDARLLDEVRSYGELVSATIEAIRTRRAQLQREGGEATVGRVRIAGPATPGVERAGALTPYLLESVVEDARRAGPGARVTIAVDETASDEQIDRLRERLARLERVGVAVEVGRRADPQGSLRTGS